MIKNDTQRALHPCGSVHSTTRPGDVQCVSARMPGGLGAGTKFTDSTQQWSELPPYTG